MQAKCRIGSVAMLSSPEHHRQLRRHIVAAHCVQRIQRQRKSTLCLGTTSHA